jgi:hypothetical protein
MTDSVMTVEHKGAGRYNVINADGDKVNEEWLSKDAAEKMVDRPNRNSRRRERVSYGKMRSRLSLDAATKDRLKKMGKVERWVNDDGGRLQELHGRGYDFFSADGSEIVGDPDGAYQAPGGDSHKREYVGLDKTGNPMYAYLMVTDVENFEEDARAKEAENMKIDDGIRGGASPGPNDTNVSSSQGSTSVKDVQYKP